MYGLRSRKRAITEFNSLTEVSSDEEQCVPLEHRSKKKRGAKQINNGRRKVRKLVDKELFDPKHFDKGNRYDDIHDSGDSDSEADFPPHPDEEKYSLISSNSDSSSEESNEDTEDEDSDETESDIDNDIGFIDDDVELDDDGRIDEPFGPNIEEYFDTNAGPLVAIITKRLKAKFPDLEPDDLKKAVEKALKKAKNDLVDEYCGAVPKDASWKAELEMDEVEKLEPELKQLRKNIKEREPTIPKILKSGLSLSEKERAIQIYDALKNSEPYTLDYMYLSLKLADMIRSATGDLDPSIDEKLRELRDKMEAKTPSLEKIMAARITESDRMRALQLYEMLHQCNINTEDWFDTQRRINSILDAQLESQEEVARLEAEEASMKGAAVVFHVDLKRKIFELDADPAVKSRIYEMYTEMISSGVSDSKYSDLKEKIVWAIKLPHRKTLPPFMDISTPEGIRRYCAEVYKRLDSEIYGMKQAKERVVLTVNNRIYNTNSRALLALKGKPGVGKTKLAKTIAKAVGLPFDKISLGGAIDSTLFKGSDSHWSGSSPSMLLQILSRVKYSSCVVLLDEIDKLGATEHGIAVQHALLHVLDPSQHKEFQDTFLSEFPHDISNIWFIPAMNDDSKLDPALKDRLDIVEVPPYTREDMVQIIKKHTLPETLIDKGIKPEDVTISDDAARALLNSLGREVENSGMRPVERAINDIASKLNLLRSFQSADDTSIPLSFKLPDFKGFPYVITPETIKNLHINNREPQAYELMFS